MGIELRLPEMSGSGTSARIAAWLKREGDSVTAGEPLVEVETEKTNLEVEAPASGILQKIHRGTGAELQAGDLLATISADQNAHSHSNESRPDQPPPRPEPDELDISQAVDVEVRPQPTQSVSVTPMAHRMAALAGLNIDAIEGSGPGGRILKIDVERALGEQRTPADTSIADRHAEAPVAAAESQQAVKELTLTPMRRVTAERLTRAKQTIPHFYLQVDCAAGSLIDGRRRINAAHGTTLTVTDFVVHAAARALRRIPLANSSWSGHTVRVHETIDIAVAVTTSTGLIAPVVRKADQKSLGEISKELRNLIERARGGQLTPGEYTGGTFTISNLGMYGISSLYAIINPPQSCVLGVGAIEQRPVVRDGQLAVGEVMTCTLSADHRVIDGAIGADWLATFRSFIEDPWTLVL